MRRFTAPMALLLVMIVAAPSAMAQAFEVKAERRSGRSFLRAAGGVLAANALVWGVNRYATNEPSARVGTRSWQRNLGARFTWDGDGFINNQLGHPYHGGLYFTAARVNGYGFWASVPFTAAGSLLWEIMGETTAPSINDLVNTTLGGMTLGEITHRLSSRALQGSGTGRRVAAAAVSPAGGAHRLIGAVPEQEAGLDTAALFSGIAIGYMRQGGAGAGNAQAFVELTAEAGSPFGVAARRPFETFEFEVEVTAGDQAVVTRARASGLLARQSLHRTEQSQLVAGVFQEYDYVNVGPHEAGGQSLRGGLLYRRSLGPATEIRLGAQLRGLVLGGISSAHPAGDEPSYDYGPGLGSTLSLSLRRDGRELLRLEHTSLRLWSISGAEATHRTSFTRAGIRLPIAGEFGVGGDLGILGRNSRSGLSAAGHRFSRLRIYLIGPSS